MSYYPKQFNSAPMRRAKGETDLGGLDQARDEILGLTFFFFFPTEDRLRFLSQVRLYAPPFVLRN